MTTYDFSMKSVMCYLEKNEVLKKSMLREVKKKQKNILMDLIHNGRGVLSPNPQPSRIFLLLM